MTIADQIEALDVVEVTQADREAAADVWRDYIARIGEVMAEKAIRKGISDDTIIVQAFARHRIAALRLAETSSSAAQEDMEYLRGVANEMGFPSVLEALESLAETSSTAECGLPTSDGLGALADRVETSAADDETYEIGKRDGYEAAIQEIDLATGGDGEFVGSTLPGRTVDVPIMRQRILDKIIAAIAEDRRGRTFSPTKLDAAYAAGRAEMRKEAVGYAKNLALEFEKGGAYDESVVATSLAEGICALGDKP